MSTYATGIRYQVLTRKQLVSKYGNSIYEYPLSR